mgnify:CR=1 FL=1
MVHRDLYEEQVLLGDRVGLIDLDDAALGFREDDKLWPKALEALVNEVRHVASVNTRTTVVLQSFYEHRPMLPAAGA